MNVTDQVNTQTNTQETKVCEVCEVASLPLMVGVCPACCARLEAHRLALADLEAVYRDALAAWRTRWADVPEVMQDAPTLAYSAGLSVSEGLES